jgi:hypothetical protein
VLDQPSGSVEPFQQFTAEVRSTTRRHFLYPSASLHVTLLGCTQRRRRLRDFPEARLAAIKGICTTTLAGKSGARLRLTGVGISGAQVFVQGYCEDNTWPALRAELGEALIASGEDPMTYLNKWPAHLNLIRCTSTDRDELSKLLRIVERHRTTSFGMLELTEVELLLTDFVVSAAASRHIASFRLRAALCCAGSNAHY